MSCRYLTTDFRYGLTNLLFVDVLKLDRRIIMTCKVLLVNLRVKLHFSLNCCRIFFCKIKWYSVPLLSDSRQFNKSIKIKTADVNALSFFFIFSRSHTRWYLHFFLLKWHHLSDLAPSGAKTALYNFCLMLFC